MKKRIEPLSTPRPQRFFFLKAKNKYHFMNISSSLRPPGSLGFVAIFSYWGEKNVSFSISSADQEKRIEDN